MAARLLSVTADAGANTCYANFSVPVDLGGSPVVTVKKNGSATGAPYTVPASASAVSRFSIELFTGTFNTSDAFTLTLDNSGGEVTTTQGGAAVASETDFPISVDAAARPRGRIADERGTVARGAR